ncbi:MAG TPA: folylpolyglutamate synthase/dihydrofolate synthase family protein [Chloroflexota bacterium]|nr:folylpolyglutamate synthase/dihydrofolate synthase family protein [Chloroflexota bacterium]
MTITYDDSVAYLESLYRLPVRPASDVGLERAAYLLRAVGNPHRAYRSVHVTGSTGKGSTSTMIARIMEASGLETGLFRSPHLVDYTERISIGGTDITQVDWAHHVAELIPVAEHMRESTSWGRPSLFELLFALASLYFAEAAIPWVVAEVGLGGRLDATNLLTSDISVITNVSLEHTQVLGGTTSQIAREKAAIIKPGSTAVTAADDAAALAEIEAAAAGAGAELLRVGRDIEVQSMGTLIEPEVRLAFGQERVRATLGARGRFQVVNAATAYGAAVGLRRSGVPLSTEDIRSGLRHGVVPGRFEFIPGRPAVIVDGAHNAAGARALADTLAGHEPVTVLFAAMADKDLGGMARALAPVVRHIVITSVPDSSRGARPEHVAAAFDGLAPIAAIDDDPERALSRALALAGDGTLLVTGSLYLVGNVRHRLMGVPAT